MCLSKQLMWVNVSALVTNALFLLLAILKVWPALLSIALFIGCLAGCILFSAKVQGLTIRRKRQPERANSPFHSELTERVAALSPRYPKE